MQETRPEVLTYHLATNYFRDRQPATLRGVLMQRRKGPIQLDDRIQLLELLRLTACAASAFALVCCGSLEVALAEEFPRAFDVSLPPGAINLDAFAKHYLSNPEFSVSQMVDFPERADRYRPGRILALQRFAGSEPYQACLGKTGGTSRADYEAEVLAIDRQVHLPLETLSAETENFVQFACLFGTIFVMGAAGAITLPREQRLCELREIANEQVRDVEKELGWNLRDQEATYQILEGALRYKNPDLTNVHCVEIGQEQIKDRTLHGVAIVKAHHIRAAMLDVVTKEPPSRHANIVGWPTQPDPEMEKSERKELAAVIAQHAELIRR